MNQTEREFVMGVAGVRLWYARAPLPGAAPSPVFDFGISEKSEADAVAISAPPAAAMPDRPSSDSSRQGLARLQGLLASTAGEKSSEADDQAGAVTAGAGIAALSTTAGELSRSTAETAVVEREPEPALARQTGHALSGKTVGFHWRFWVGDKWLLVSHCPDAAGRGLEDRLASNILSALDDVVTSSEALRWPVFSNPAVPGNDASGAAEVVAAIAETVTRPRQLWLGLESEDPDAEASGIWRQISAPLGKATVSFPMTLASLSSDPGAKKALWQALQQAGRS